LGLGQARCSIGADDDRAEARQLWRTAGRVGAVGLEMGISVAIGYFAGAWLDGKFDTAPVLGYVGLALGIGAAGKALWSTARKLNKDQTPEAPD
jgi:hypothetical protein